MNNKGFTLVEVLAVVAILALIGTLTAPSVLKSLDLGKKTSDDVLINNIRVALQTMYEEGYYGNTEFYQYNLSGVTATKFGVTDSTDSITVNLQTLVGNGFLTGVNNEISASCSGTTNCNKKVILNSTASEADSKIELLIDWEFPVKMAYIKDIIINIGQIIFNID